MFYNAFRFLNIKYRALSLTSYSLSIIAQISVTDNLLICYCQTKLHFIPKKPVELTTIFISIGTGNISLGGNLEVHKPRIMGSQYVVGLGLHILPKNDKLHFQDMV